MLRPTSWTLCQPEETRIRLPGVRSVLTACELLDELAGTGALCVSTVSLSTEAHASNAEPKVDLGASHGSGTGTGVSL